MLIRPASNRDLKAITHLLASFGLPTVGISNHVTDFLVAEDGGAIIASAGLEVYGSHALLRSVAVQGAYQGRGVARDLVQTLLERAREKRIQRLYLLTETATDYFQRLGFVPLPRDKVDPAVRASEEFQGLCCDTAVAMMQVIESPSA